MYLPTSRDTQLVNESSRDHVIWQMMTGSRMSHRGLLQTVQQVMMMHLEAGVGLTHQRLSRFLRGLRDTNDTETQNQSNTTRSRPKLSPPSSETG